MLSVVEDDPETGIYYVGRGCYPNMEGVVQLDAALMRGRDCAFGAVASLERLAVKRVILLNSPLLYLVKGCSTYVDEQDICWCLTLCRPKFFSKTPLLH